VSSVERNRDWGARSKKPSEGSCSLGNVSRRRTVFALTMFLMMLSMRVYSEDNNSTDTSTSVQSFLGRWDLTLSSSNVPM